MDHLKHIRAWLTAKLPYFIIFLFVVQPVMDIMSFWFTKLEFGNTLTLLLRFGVLGLTLLLGFGLSHRKKVYWIAAGICLAIGLGHCFALYQYGIRDLVGDLTNYIRVLQMPLTTLCLITFLRENQACYEAMKRGILASLLLILSVTVLASLTGTEPHTYMDGKGYIGWFNNTNSQSFILTMLVPVTMAWLYGKKGFKSPLFWLVTLGGYAAMYLLGTRLCYLGIVASGFGLGISILLIRPANWLRACVFFASSILFLSLMPFSPMVRHQGVYEDVQSNRQSSINTSISEHKLEPLNDENLSEEELQLRREKWIETLSPIYELYAPDFTELFGARRTIEMYDYTSEIKEITAARPKKLQFARLLMEDSPISARFFGLELSRFLINGNNYDVENDLHGIYYLYGWVGLLAMLAFLLYFLYLIAAALLRNAKTYFTLDAASWGIALIMCLIHVYCTAGVLRRPNASFYLSAILAAVYYLVKIKVYDKSAYALRKVR